MTGEGLRAKNNAPTKENLRKERKVKWIKRCLPVLESSLNIIRFVVTTLMPVVPRGGARGGLGGYSTPSEHAGTPSEGESDFFGYFWHL